MKSCAYFDTRSGMLWWMSVTLQINNDFARPAISFVADIRAADTSVLAPRAKGALHLIAKRRGTQTVISDLRQEGSLKALFPQARGTALDTVLLNTAGGLTGGDKMSLSVTVAPDAHVVVSSQAAERVYRAMPGQVAQSDVVFSVGQGGRIDWLPQETILFDQAALNRRLNVYLAVGATALLVEPVIFGRVAMGETVRTVHFTDHWRIWRDDKIVFADAVRMIGDAKSMMQQRAIANGAGAMATVLFAGPQAAVLDAKVDLPMTCGKSLIANDLLLVRILEKDGFTLRRELIRVIETLSGTPIPRVWRL